jgi:hypothetical protein
MNPKREGNGRANRAAAPVVRGNLRALVARRWADIDAGTVHDLVKLVTEHGAAIMFGVTSDQGAYSVLVLDNNNKIKEYPHDEVDVENLLSWLRDEYFGAGGKPAA